MLCAGGGFLGRPRGSFFSEFVPSSRYAQYTTLTWTTSAIAGALSARRKSEARYVSEDLTDVIASFSLRERVVSWLREFIYGSDFRLNQLAAKKCHEKAVFFFSSVSLCLFITMEHEGRYQ